MPVVRISDQSFASLGTLGIWFKTDTPSDTIDKIVRKTMAELEHATEIIESFASTSKIYRHFPEDSVAFTKPFEAQVGKLVVQKPNWSNILLAAIRELSFLGFVGKQLEALLEVPSRAQPYQKEGFRYYADLKLSIQGQSASDACEEICRIAVQHGIALRVGFAWRDNHKAIFPGKSARIEIGSS
jgi:hypothetical protein